MINVGLKGKNYTKNVILYMKERILMKKEENIRTMVRSAMFLALAYILPFFTGQIPQIGAMLCPMHIPVLVCGFLCGGKWGFAVGMAAPLLRSITLGMPPLFPKAVCMAAELAAYGAVVGMLYKRFPPKGKYIYVSLLLAMITGRVVWGSAMWICLGLNGESFGFSAFLAGAVTNAVPGIILQIVLIPILIMYINRTDTLT